LTFLNICVRTPYGSEPERTMYTTFTTFHTEGITPCNSFFSARCSAAS